MVHDGVGGGEDDDGDAGSGVLVSAKTGHSAAGDVDNAVYRPLMAVLAGVANNDARRSRGSC